MNYIIYKTTQISTGRIYIGKQSVAKLDGFFGKGGPLGPLVDANPDDFKCEILHKLKSSREACWKHAEIVTPEFLEGKGTTVFNNVPGGQISSECSYAWNNWQPGEEYPFIQYTGGPLGPYSKVRIFSSNKEYIQSPTIQVPGFKEHYVSDNLDELLRMVDEKVKYTGKCAQSFVNEKRRKGEHLFYMCAVRETPEGTEKVLVVTRHFHDMRVIVKMNDKRTYDKHLYATKDRSTPRLFEFSFDKSEEVRKSPK